ncbi:MAG: hypothetical protein DI622_13095 [Chryseobacterium sp.]|nr:MAG: hypothetical protein DI622_13095 [Chryseobacterium sp.]
MNKRIFLTHIVPKDKIGVLNVSAAGNYFSYNLIDNNCFDQVWSIIPTNIDEKIESNDDINYIETRFLINKSIFKLFNTFIDNLKVFLKIKGNVNLWYYNLTHQTFFLFLLFKIFKPSVKQFVILLDFTPSKSKISLQGFIFSLINKCDGVISLTANKFLTQENIIVLPGIVTNIKNNSRITNINKSFILSGILSKNRCPELILKVFSEFPEYALIITGKIEDQNLVDRYCTTFPNINYLGFLNYDDYLKELEKATFSINSRDPEYEENLYNFPSKSIEHLMHNKILVSTMQYEELNGIEYIYVKPDLENLRKFLRELKTFENDELITKYANQSSKVFDLFGIDNWKKSFKKIENKNEKHDKKNI